MDSAGPGWTPATQTARSVSSRSREAESDLDLAGVFRLLVQNWKKLLFATLLTIGLGLAFLLVTERSYEAKSTLILDAQEQNATGLDSLVGGFSGDDTELNSQIEIIRSRKIVGTVVDDLDLQTDPEFTKELRKPGLLAQAIALVRSRPTTGPKQPLRESAIDALIEKLGLSVVPKTHVFQIRLRTNDPVKSATIVNTLADVFVRDQVVAKLESNSDAAEWLNEKVAVLGEDLARAEAAAADYRSNTERNVTEADIVASNVSLKNARGRRDSFLTNLRQGTGSDLPRTERDIQRLQTLERDIESLETIVNKQNEDLLRLRQLDREAKAATTIYQHFVTRLNEIEVQKGLQESDVRTLSAAIPRYDPVHPKPLLILILSMLAGLVLGAIYVVIRKLLDSTFVETSVLQDTFGIKVAGAIPVAPVKDRLKLIRYAMTRRESALMEAVRDMRTSLGLSRATLVSSTGSGDAVQELRPTNGTLLMTTSSIPGEGKTTCSILMALTSIEMNVKVLLVECDMRKSTFSQYFGRPPQAVLGDVVASDDDAFDQAVMHHKSGLDIIFGGSGAKQPGRMARWRSGVLKAIGLRGKSREMGRNAADVFDSIEFQTFLERAKSRYDLIVLDTPPVLPVPDARVIARHADLILYAVHSGSTPQTIVDEGLRKFANLNVEVSALALTQVRKGAGYGYGYGGEAYHNN